MSLDDIKYTITIDLDDLDFCQLDNIVRQRLIQAKEDMSYDGEPEDIEIDEALEKVIKLFSTPSQWEEYSKES